MRRLRAQRPHVGHRYLQLEVRRLRPQAAALRNARHQASALVRRLRAQRPPAGRRCPARSAKTAASSGRPSDCPARYEGVAGAAAARAAATRRPSMSSARSAKTAASSGRPTESPARSGGAGAAAARAAATHRPSISTARSAKTAASRWRASERLALSERAGAAAARAAVTRRPSTSGTRKKFRLPKRQNPPPRKQFVLPKSVKTAASSGRPTERRAPSGGAGAAAARAAATHRPSISTARSAKTAASRCRASETLAPSERAGAAAARAAVTRRPSTSRERTKFRLPKRQNPPPREFAAFREQPMPTMQTPISTISSPMQQQVAAGCNESMLVRSLKCSNASAQGLPPVLGRVERQFDLRRRHLC
eukprot:SAG31_NODE_3608_length_4068_cov_7.979854_3_plen_365_part_00